MLLQTIKHESVKVIQIIANGGFSGYRGKSVGDNSWIRKQWMLNSKTYKNAYNSENFKISYYQMESNDAVIISRKP